jgi:hypothetical protein
MLAVETAGRRPAFEALFAATSCLRFHASTRLVSWRLIVRLIFDFATEGCLQAFCDVHDIPTPA